MNHQQFLRERNEAFLSLNKQKIMAYIQKYDIRAPKNELVFWAGVHKARLQLNIPESEKQKSREWLLRNGFKAGVS